jgi:archaellum component FlaF (FlaF/FlaG flagellin family)
MRPVKVSKTGAGSSSVVPLDHYLNPFNVGFGVVVSGTVNYTIQHTFDDVFNAAVTPVWFNHPTIASLAVNADGNYAFPVRAIKVLVNSGAGTATLTAIQAGSAGN